MITIKTEATLSPQFLGDVLVTAFDGAYGWSWNWFEPATGSWLTVEHTETCARTVQEWSTVPPECTCRSTDQIWKSAAVKLKADCQTGDNVIDNTNPDGFVVTHEVLARGIERIINDDYFGAMREVYPRELDDILKAHGRGVAEGEIHGRKFRRNRTLGIYQIETGETARAYREMIQRAVNEDCADIDAPASDCIVQAGLFGRVIFS